MLIGHELGHIMSGHATYTHDRADPARAQASRDSGLGLIALPFQLALLEWSRKAELSADRAGLLASQDPHVTMGMYLKLAGGNAATTRRASTSSRAGGGVRDGGHAMMACSR